MTSRGRSALIAAGVGVGIVVLFLGTVWIFMATLGEEGLPTGGPRVAVVEIEYTLQPDLHTRYQIDAAPITVLVDRQGVTRAAFIGAYSAPDLWSALADLRAAPS